MVIVLWELNVEKVTLILPLSGLQQGVGTGSGGVYSYTLTTIYISEGTDGGGTGFIISTVIKSSGGIANS